MHNKTYRLTIEFERYKKSFEGVRNIRVENDGGIARLKFTSKYGEEFEFVVSNISFYYYEEE